MSKYLYGASIQGIQDFIFKTNELKHIVGASELVEEICTSAFEEFYGCKKEEGVVVKAAGNIKYVFENENECKAAVRNFMRKVMKMAPGVTVSQAVCPFDSNEDFGNAVSEVERMLKIQRNRPPRSVTMGLMGMKRANNTGLPVTHIIKTDGEVNFVDDATQAKLEKSKNIARKLCAKSFGDYYVSHSRIAYDISEITDKNDWIAIVHADGNGLGKIVQKVGRQRDDFKLFSTRLDEATKIAANRTFDIIRNSFDPNDTIPIRPVVLSGDDMTVIIRGSLAIPYTKVFIAEFENATEELLGDILKKYHVFEDGSCKLTACAGIAFIKKSYPFYYGYQLAEELCSQAKKDTKTIAGLESGNLPASCLMFHKVQDSFITNYNDIISRELTAKDNLSFVAGPYYIKEQKDRFTIEKLEGLATCLDSEDGNGVKSGIRKWISVRLKDAYLAEQRRDRMVDIFKGDVKTVESITAEDRNVCIAYDVLAYHTIINQETKTK